MATWRKRIWGMALTAGVFGMGCSAVSLAAGPAPVDKTTAAGEGGGGAASDTALLARVSAIEEALTRADAAFITQYHHNRYNPNEPGTNNANCGPTSLAMALRALGRAPENLTDAAHAQALIRMVRQAMTGRVDENNWTYPIQVREGARKLGLNAELVFGIDGIKQALSKPGRMVVVNVNPSPAYGERLAVPYDGGHFALVTGIQGDQAFLNDPLGPRPLVISLAQLQTALTTPLGRDPYGNWIAAYNGGVVVW